MADPRLHGPETCPVAPAGCEACSGQHHWLEAGFDPESYDEDDELSEHEAAVLAWDREHLTDHALAYFVCKHCPAWAEAEYMWELEGDDILEDDGPDHLGPPCPLCGGEMEWEDCWHCNGGGGFHDCGEDCCPHLHPELDLNETCEECNGLGGYMVCPRTGEPDHRKEAEPS